MDRPRSSTLLDLIATAEKLGEWKYQQQLAAENLKRLDERVEGLKPYLRAADKAIRLGRGVRHASLRRAKIIRDRDEVLSLRKETANFLEMYRWQTRNLKSQLDRIALRLDSDKRL